MNEELPNRELDALIAERLLGWEWFERNNEVDGMARMMKAIFPPERDGWQRVNFHVSQWKLAQESTERFSDWDQCCRNYDYAQNGLPYFSSDISAAIEVVEKMRERGFGIVIADHYSALPWAVSFDDGHDQSEVNDNSLPRAICLAALNAQASLDSKIN